MSTQKKSKKKTAMIHLIINTAIAVIGVVISILAMVISFNTYIIQKKQSIPLIDVSITKENVQTDVPNRYTSYIEEVRLSNKGGPVKEIYIDVIPFFYMVYDIEDDIEDDMEDDAGYYSTSEILIFDDGLLSEEKGISIRTNDLEVINFDAGKKAFEQYMPEWAVYNNQKWQTEGRRISFLVLGYYIFVDYTDVYGDEKKECFKCIPGIVYKFSEYYLYGGLEPNIGISLADADEIEKRLDEECFEYKSLLFEDDLINLDILYDNLL